MKLAKLSLAAMVVAGLATSSFAADTLADAFAKGKVSGELRAWYWDHDGGTAATDAEIFSTGLKLGYVTDSFAGFTMGATFQSNFAPFADTAAKDLFEGDQYGSGAVLSEAYLGYKMKNTTVKVGRQFISTPVVSGSGSRMILESFEGVTLVNTDLPQTTLIAGYVQKFQGRTSDVTPGGANDADASAPEFSKIAAFTGAATNSFDGAYTVAAINKSITNLTLTAQYAEVMDYNNAVDVSVYYAEGNYVLPMSSFKLGFDANYWASSTSTTTTLEGAYTGLRVSLADLAGFGASFAYGTTTTDDSVVLGMGNGPTTYTGILIDGSSKTITADTDSYKLQATYDFSKVGVAGLKALAQYVVVEAPASDYTALAAEVSYAVPALKGLALSVQYETLETDPVAAGAATTDLDRVRFRANYKF